MTTFDGADPVQFNLRPGDAGGRPRCADRYRWVGPGHRGDSGGGQGASVMSKLPILFMNVVVIGCLAAAVNSVPMSPGQWLIAFCLMLLNCVNLGAGLALVLTGTRR
jgi:hypothetical protein